MMIKANITIATITPTLELLLLSDCEDESVGELILVIVALVLVGALLVVAAELATNTMTVLKIIGVSVVARVLVLASVKLVL